MKLNSLSFQKFPGFSQAICEYHWRRQLQRFFLVYLVTVFAVGSQAQKTNQTSDSELPVVTFNCSWNEATPQKYTITVQSSGKAKYVSSSPTKPPDANGVSDENYAIDFVLSDTGRKKVFYLAKEAKYFNGDFDYKNHPVASTGEKNMAFADVTRHFQTNYNYSENKYIQELTALFQGISSTIQHGRRLQFLRRFDRLGLEAELKGMEGEDSSHFLAELQIIAPLLKSIADDATILNIARQRAKRLLATASHEEKSTNP